MKTDITFGQYHKVIDAPEGVHYVGVSVRYKGVNFSIVTGVENCGAVREDDEIILDDGIKVILHNYSSPELAELAKEFKGFENLKIGEIQTGELYLFQTI